MLSISHLSFAFSRMFNWKEKVHCDFLSLDLFTYFTVAILFYVEEVVHTSEYAYVANDKPNQLCHTSNFQWEKNVDVHLVVSGKTFVCCSLLILACSCSLMYVCVQSGILVPG